MKHDDETSDDVLLDELRRHMRTVGLTPYGVVRAVRDSGARVSRSTIYNWLAGRTSIGTSLATEVLRAVKLRVKLIKRLDEEGTR